MELTQLLLDESKLLCNSICHSVVESAMNYLRVSDNRLDRLNQTAKELCEATGRSCVPALADVRQPQTLKEAVERAIEQFGRIDFVICGK